MIMTQFEKDAVKAILLKESKDLVGSVSKLEVSERRESSVGKMTYFSSTEQPPSEGLNLTLGKSLYADITGMKYGAGFMLYIDNGVPSALEVFCHDDESIPIEVSEYSLKYL